MEHQSIIILFPFNKVLTVEILIIAAVQNNESNSSFNATGSKQRKKKESHCL
jgi:hypothetical protein